MTDTFRAVATDGVTGLMARGPFLAMLDEPPARGRLLAVARLRGLRDLNGALGIGAGDRLLATLGLRLLAAAGGGPAGRLGSSELAAVVPAGRSAAATAALLHAALTDPVVLGGRRVVPQVTVGAVPCAAAGADRLLFRADLALTAAAEAAVPCDVYDEVRHQGIADRRHLMVDLMGAAGRGELVVHYQPVVELSGDRLVGAEALVRWARDGALLMPDSFIPAAEESGAIAELGRWTLAEACRQMAVWNAARPGAEPLHVGVNVSVRQLTSGKLVAELGQVIREAGLPAAAINLEVTESQVMSDVELMISRLGELKELGVGLSLDDFGTGYSSLSFLRRLPVDILKIDKSFVAGIASNDEEWSLAVAIIKLATSLGKRTLAEGVETPAQMAHLRALRCDLGQGYLFGRPLAAPEFERLLATRRAGGR